MKVDDARRRGLNIIMASDFEGLDPVIDRHAENFFDATLSEVYWDDSLTKKDEKAGNQIKIL
jgi:hypothetical protein